MLRRIHLKGFKNKSVEEIIRTSIACPHCKRIIDYDSIIMQINQFATNERIATQSCPCCGSILIETTQKLGFVFFENTSMTDGKREVLNFRHYTYNLSFEYTHKQQGEKDNDTRINKIYN